MATAVTPTVPQLRAFVEVARTRHFGEAADRIGVSQPTLSQALATLETNLGLQLIERSPRLVLVTPAGERLLPLAEQALTSLEAVTAAVEPARWLSGPLSIGVIPTIAPYLLPAALRALRREAPELTVSIREDQTERLVEGLRRGALDVAILALPAAEPGLHEIAIYEEDFVLATPRHDPLAGRTGLEQSSLAHLEQPLLLLAQGHCLRDQALDVCALAGAADSSSDTTQASSLATIVQLVAADMGSTLLPATAVPVEARGARVGIATFAEPAPGRRVGLLYRATTNRAEEFADLAEILRRAVVGRRLPARPVSH